MKTMTCELSLLRNQDLHSKLGFATRGRDRDEEEEEEEAEEEKAERWDRDWLSTSRSRGQVTGPVTYTGL